MCVSGLCTVNVMLWIGSNHTLLQYQCGTSASVMTSNIAVILLNGNGDGDSDDHGVDNNDGPDDTMLSER
eukprot:9829-Eustigmatos_ZCMA.PRE.1